MGIRKKKKKKRVEHHVAQKALQRYGIVLSAKDQRNIITKQIQNNDVNTYGKKLTNTRSLHLVKLQGKYIPVIYNNKSEKLHTVLPPEDYHVLKHYKGLL